MTIDSHLFCSFVRTVTSVKFLVNTANAEVGSKTTPHAHRKITFVRFKKILIALHLHIIYLTIDKDNFFTIQLERFHQIIVVRNKDQFFSTFSCKKSLHEIGDMQVRLETVGLTVEKNLYETRYSTSNAPTTICFHTTKTTQV